VQNPYQVLGIPATADEAAIKRAYRAKAKLLHPDLNPGDPSAASAFEQLSEAYQLLRDPDARARYDAGEESQEASWHEADQAPRYGEAAAEKYWRAAGSERQGFWEGGAFARWAFTEQGESDGGFFSSEAARDASSFDDSGSDIFADLYDEESPEGMLARTPQRGHDIVYELRVPFLKAARGGRQRVLLAEERDIEVDVPPGVDEGEFLRLAGLGHPGPNDGPRGDALLRVRLLPHSHFSRHGRDVHLTLPISLKEAILGGSVEVPTIHGRVLITLPPGNQQDSQLRLRGLGIGGGIDGASAPPPSPDDLPDPTARGWFDREDAASEKTSEEAGDQILHLSVALPDRREPELESLIAAWHPRNDVNPRQSSNFDLIDLADYVGEVEEAVREIDRWQR